MILTLSVYAALATLLAADGVDMRAASLRPRRAPPGRATIDGTGDPLPPRMHKAPANARALKRLSCAFRREGEFAKIDREQIWLSRS